MIITESFVWINFPKTGSTFVRQALRELYGQNRQPRVRLSIVSASPERWMKEIELPNIRVQHGTRMGQPNPHGLRCQIPAEYRHLPLVSAIRDPVARAVSAYKFADWRKPEALLAPLSDVQSRLPGFPDLTFSEWCSYRNEFTQRSLTIAGRPTAIDVQSFDFLRFFLPNGSVNAVSAASFEALYEVMSPARFLRVESSLRH